MFQKSTEILASANDEMLIDHQQSRQFETLYLRAIWTSLRKPYPRRVRQTVKKGLDAVEVPRKERGDFERNRDVSPTVVSGERNRLPPQPAKSE